MSAPVGPLWDDATSPSVNALVATLPALIFSILGLVTMIGFTIIVEGKKVDNQHMLMLAEKIHKGAVDFLKTEYKFLAVFVLALLAISSGGSLDLVRATLLQFAALQSALPPVAPVSLTVLLFFFFVIVVIVELEQGSLRATDSVVRGLGRGTRDVGLAGMDPGAPRQLA